MESIIAQADEPRANVRVSRVLLPLDAAADARGVQLVRRRCVVCVPVRFIAPS